jgi:hypothetical protein
LHFCGVVRYIHVVTVYVFLYRVRSNDDDD